MRRKELIIQTETNIEERHNNNRTITTIYKNPVSETNL